MNTKIIIPCRYQSTRLPQKLMLEILNKPIFWHVVQRCREAGFSNEDIYIATDHDEIFKKATNFGIQSVMTSSSHQSGTDRVFEATQKLGLSDEDYIINVQGDEPLINPQLIKEVSKSFHQLPDFKLYTAVTKFHCYDDFINPNMVKAVVENNQAIYFSRSPVPMNRENPEDYSLSFKHIGIYGYKVTHLKEFCQHDESVLERCEKLEQLRAISNNMSIHPVIFEGNVLHGVDTETDFNKIKKEMEG